MRQLAVTAALLGLGAAGAQVQVTSPLVVEHTTNQLAPTVHSIAP